MIRTLRLIGLYKLAIAIRLLRSLLPAQKQRPVLIVFVNAIGDFVIFSGMVEAIKEKYAGRPLHLAGFDRWISLAESSGVFDHIIPMNRAKFTSSIAYQIKYLWQVAATPYECVIYPAHSRMWQGDLVVAASRSGHKIACDGDLNNQTAVERKLANRFYHQLAALSSSGEKKENQLLAQFGNALGLSVPDTIKPHVWINENDHEMANTLLREIGISGQQEYCIIVGGAASPKRIWAAENYVPALQWLSNRNVVPVFCGAGADADFYASVEQVSPVDTRSLVNRTSLPVLAALIQKAALYIGTETGTLQIACAVETPSICIMGGGHFARFYPHKDKPEQAMIFHEMECFGCNWKCIYDSVRCIEQIEADQLVQALEKISAVGIANA